MKNRLYAMLAQVTAIEKGAAEPRQIKEAIGSAIQFLNGWREMTVNDLHEMKEWPAKVVDAHGRKLTRLEREEGWVFKCVIDGAEGQIGGMDIVYAGESGMGFDVV